MHKNNDGDSSVLEHTANQSGFVLIKSHSGAYIRRKVFTAEETKQVMESVRIAIDPVFKTIKKKWKDQQC